MAEIHPLIRLVTLLLFTAGASFAPPGVLLAGLLLLAVIYLYCGFPSMAGLLTMLKRLRWLMLAIMLVYGWWTPGTALLPAAAMLSPTVEGIQSGLMRLLVLVMIVAAVHLLLQRTAREQLLASLMQLFTPFCSRKFRERIAVRIVLSMDAVTQIQPLLHQALSGRPVFNQRMSGLGQAAADIYMAVIDRVNQVQCDPINVNEVPPPALWQWSIPLLLLTAMILIF